MTITHAREHIHTHIHKGNIPKISNMEIMNIFHYPKSRLFNTLLLCLRNLAVSYQCFCTSQFAIFMKLKEDAHSLCKSRINIFLTAAVTRDLSFSQKLSLPLRRNTPCFYGHCHFLMLLPAIDEKLNQGLCCFLVAPFSL